MTLQEHLDRLSQLLEEQTTLALGRRKLLSWSNASALESLADAVADLDRAVRYQVIEAAREERDRARFG